MRSRLILLFCGWILFSNAQPGVSFIETQNALESLKIAQTLINQEKYEKARFQLQETIRMKKDFAVAYRELGKVLLKLEEYQQAAKDLETSFELDAKLSRSAYFECGEAYFKSGVFDEALKYFQKYKELEEEKFTNSKKESGLEQDYNIQAPIRIQNIEYIKAHPPTQVKEHPTHLGNDINTKKDEYFPYLSAREGHLLFTRKGKYSDENIHVSALKKEKWGRASRLSDINTEMNEGMAKLSTNERALYFAACFWEGTEGGCDLYAAEYDEGDVSNPQIIEGAINSSSWDSQPVVSCDGQHLYFSSTRPGGYGGADIYLSIKQSNGDWGKPQNLGPEINTPGDEEAPFIAQDGLTLYFTSNGWPGYGDGDIFISKKFKSGWQAPKNLGFPINTQFKEFGLFLSPNAQTAYYASAREGGQGGLDLYSFEMPETFRPEEMLLVSGQIKNASDGEPIETVIDITPEVGRVISSDEKGWFFTCLPTKKVYAFQVDEPGFEFFMEAMLLEGQEGNNSISLEFELTPEGSEAPAQAQSRVVAPSFKPLPTAGIIEKNYKIFFGFDEAEINFTNEQFLKDVIRDMAGHINWEVEIVGYADASGNAEYNKKLSERRATAVYNYLTGKGVVIDNVKYEGRGSGASGDDKQNRRVEIRLRRE